MSLQCADKLVEFMRVVWANQIESTNNGIIESPSLLYDEYHDARKVAQLMGGIKRYGTQKDHGFEYGYDLPDGSRVAINTPGNSIRKVKKHQSYASRNH